MRKRAIDSKTGESTKIGLTGLLQIIDRPYISNSWHNLKDKKMLAESKLASYIRTLSTSQNLGKTFKDSDKDWSIEDSKIDEVETKSYSVIWNGLYSQREINML